MITEVGERNLTVWRCDQCGNEMLGPTRPTRCTQAGCRKVADYVEGMKPGPRPKIGQESQRSPTGSE